MGNTIRDAQDAIMEGINKFRDFREEFETQFYQPEVDLHIAKWWKSLPLAVKDYYKINNKKVYDEMEKKFGGE